MAERAKHIISSFDAALYGLKNDVLMMSSLTDRLFQTAIEALFNRDSELCNHVVAEDEDVDILSPSCIGYKGGYFRDEGQHKFGADRGPLRHYRTKGEASEYQTCGARSFIAGTAVPFSGSDFS
jgi:hypothetical protein